MPSIKAHSSKCTCGHAISSHGRGAVCKRCWCPCYTAAQPQAKTQPVTAPFWWPTKGVLAGYDPGMPQA